MAKLNPMWVASCPRLYNMYGGKAESGEGESEGRREGKEKRELSIRSAGISAALTHSVNEQGTLVWFLRLNFLLH